MIYEPLAWSGAGDPGESAAGESGTPVGGRFGCANVMLIFGIEDCGPFLLEQNDQWSVKWARYMTLETIAPFRDDLTLMLPAPAT